MKKNIRNILIFIKNPCIYQTFIVSLRSDLISITMLKLIIMFSLISLPYAPDALEPVISQETIEFHHGKHLQTYVDNLRRLYASHKAVYSTTPDRYSTIISTSRSLKLLRVTGYRLRRMPLPVRYWMPSTVISVRSKHSRRSLSKKE